MDIAEAEMARVVAGVAAGTKSGKIRALARAGYSRADIARFVGCRYQFVRNVLVDDERKAERARESAAAAADAVGGDPHSMKVTVDAAGRVAIPEPARRALGLKAGDTLIAAVENGELHFLGVPAAVRKAQAIVRRFVPDDVDLVGELIDARRRDDENGQGQ